MATVKKGEFVLLDPDTVDSASMSNQGKEKSGGAPTELETQYFRLQITQSCPVMAQ
jgi:hypothetical protein